MKFWNWLRGKLAVTTTNNRLAAIELNTAAMAEELGKLRKKVVRKPRRYDQVERDRSRSAHPTRH